FVTIVIFIIGLAFFARPTRSENEKRELTPFPTFTLESFLNGEYTAQISLWFSDTYPLREQMISANAGIQSLYGIRGEQVIGGGDADDIPTGPADIEFNPTDDGKGDTFEGTYINGDTAYQLYFFNKQNSDSYVALINEFAAQVEGKAQVYDMIVPLHYQIALSEETVKKYNASDCGEAIKYMYGNLSDGIKSVDTLPNLIRHNDEYLYFRTDHHWTARGAYYAYLAFCKEKGIEPTPLEDYKQYKFDGFLGTFYANAKQPAAMKNNPDYVEAFVPIGTNREDVYDSNGNYVDWYSIVYSGADKYDAANKYLAFMGGDHPLAEIHNPNITDGSSIVVIKESYGNAFVPFLVDSYEYVYVIDYRQWNGKLSDFVIEKGIDDVLFLNVVSNTSTSARLKELSEIIK
ncbi:MAG: DHHW family protein, partial [Eubacteriales bacterium]